MFRVSGTGVSHVGLVRAENEDSAYVGSTCLVVADGVGGAAAGEIASATTAYVVSGRALAHAGDDPVTVLRDAVLFAQEQVATGIRRDPARSGMATTLTALLTDGHTFALAHVGDSRGYVLREGHLERVTADHTYVQRLVDQGSLPETAVHDHPWRNVVLRSVNGNTDEAGDVTRLPLQPGDRVLLASDGLTDLVEEPRIEALLGQHHDDAAVQALVDEALAFGGRDNITCVLATVLDGTPAPESDGVSLGALRNLDNVVDPAAVRMPHTA